MLARIQSQLSTSDDEKDRHPTPFHFISKRETSFVQSITLCPLQDSLTAGERESSMAMGSRSRSVGRGTETRGIMDLDGRHPGIALKVKLKDEYNASELAVDQFMEWLRAIPTTVEQVKVEAGYARF